MLTEEALALDGGHTGQCTHHVSQNCTLETYIILLTNVTPVNLIFTKRNPGDN